MDAIANTIRNSGNIGEGVPYYPYSVVGNKACDWNCLGTEICSVHGINLHMSAYDLSLGWILTKSHETGMFGRTQLVSHQHANGIPIPTVAQPTTLDPGESETPNTVTAQATGTSVPRVMAGR